MQTVTGKMFALLSEQNAYTRKDTSFSYLADGLPDKELSEHYATTTDNLKYPYKNTRCVVDKAFIYVFFNLIKNYF